MQLFVITSLVLLLASCTTTERSQATFVWSNENTIIQYSENAQNAPDPVIRDVWRQLINVHHHCITALPTRNAQLLCNVHIERLREKIVQLRLAKDTLCSQFIESKNCTHYLENTLNTASKKIIDATEILTIAQDR